LAVTVILPAVLKVCEIVAVANAGTSGFALMLPAVGATATAVPTCVPFTVKMTLPVGPTPLLVVLTVAVRVTGVPKVTVEGEMVTVVVAGVMVTVLVGEELALKLLSPA
jgi:hypothetical protein